MSAAGSQEPATGRHGRIRLIDFGIPAVNDGKERFSTPVRSQIRGTPAYLAPELVERPGGMTWASDSRGSPFMSERSAS